MPVPVVQLLVHINPHEWLRSHEAPPFHHRTQSYAGNHSYCQDNSHPVPEGSGPHCSVPSCCSYIVSAPSMVFPEPWRDNIDVSFMTGNSRVIKIMSSCNYYSSLSRAKSCINLVIRREFEGTPYPFSKTTIVAFSLEPMTS